MRKFKPLQKFSLVTIPFRPFQHLVEIDEQLACLTNIHRHLADEGRLVLDVFNPSLTSLTANDLGIEREEARSLICQMVECDPQSKNRRTGFDSTNPVRRTDLRYVARRWSCRTCRSPISDEILLPL